MSQDGSFLESAEGIGLEIIANNNDHNGSAGWQRETFGDA
jgi:hypothetical protein